MAGTGRQAQGTRAGTGTSKREKNPNEERTAARSGGAVGETKRSVLALAKKLEHALPEELRDFVNWDAVMGDADRSSVGGERRSRRGTKSQVTETATGKTQRKKKKKKKKKTTLGDRLKREGKGIADAVWGVTH